MSNNILFVSTQYVKDNSVINGNVDPELLVPFIVRAQDLNIESILGTDLMNQVKTAIENSTVSGVTATLLNDYVQRTVREWAIYYALPFLNYKLTNKAISKKDSDNSTPADLDEVTYLRDNVRDTAEYYSVRLRKYLIANQASFPAFTSNNDIDDIRPSNPNYFEGLYLDDDGDDCDFGIGRTIDLN